MLDIKIGLKRIKQLKMGNKKKGGKRLNKRIAQEIRNDISNKNLTQAELGKKYGVSREAINRVLTNKVYNK